VSAAGPERPGHRAANRRRSIVSSFGRNTRNDALLAGTLLDPCVAEVQLGEPQHEARLVGCVDREDAG
jgi:hypothetical protein